MKKATALIITIFLGEFGVHRFMSGKIGTGIICCVLQVVSVSVTYMTSFRLPQANLPRRMALRGLPNNKLNVKF